MLLTVVNLAINFTTVNSDLDKKEAPDF